MSVCCAQLPSAGRRVTGPRYLFVFGEIRLCDTLFPCQPWHTGKLCSGSGLALFVWFDGPCEGVWAGLCQSSLHCLETSFGCSGRGLWGAATCRCLSAFGCHTETHQILHYHSPWLQSFKDNEAWRRWSKHTCQSQMWGALGNGGWDGTSTLWLLIQSDFKHALPCSQLFSSFLPASSRD